LAQDFYILFPPGSAADYASLFHSTDPILGDPLLTSLDSIRELGSREDDLVLQALVGAAGAEDQFFRRRALEVIGFHARGRELQAVVLNAICDSSEYVVRTACDVVERRELREAHDSVLALLASPSAATRQSAIRALGTIWFDIDFPPIFGLYLNDPELDVRREAAWVLRRRVHAANWQALFDVFCVDELARHRQWACEIAERFSGAEVLPVLSTLSLDIDGHVRKAALHASRTVSGRV
jgi:HEAT repeat protein